VCNIRLDYKYGIDQVNDVLNVAIDTGAIIRESSWYSYKDHKWNGLHAARTELESNPKLRDEIYQLIRSGHEQGATCKKESTKE
jgi:hypothetical protein